MKTGRKLIQNSVSAILAILIIFSANLPSSVLPEDVAAGQSCIWFCFRGGTKRTGEVHLDCGPQSKELTHLWNYEAISQITSSAIIADSKVIFGSDDGKLHCLEQSTGRQLWETDIGQDIHSSPAYAMGNIYFGSDNGVFYCLDGESGEIVWTFETEAAIHSSPVIYNQRLFFGSYDYNIYCLDPETGKLHWKYLTYGEIFSSPAVYEKKVYIGSDDGTLYCFDFWNGDLLWSFETSMKIGTTPVFIDNRVVFGSDSIYCLSAETGNVAWEFPIGKYGVSSCAISKNRVMFCRWDGMFYCIGLYTGKHIWSKKIKGFSVAPSVCGYSIYLATDEGWFGSLDMRDGEVIWETELGETILTNPTISDGLVVIASTEGTVFCYGDELVRDCLSLDLDVVDFGTVPQKSDGQIEVNLKNCGLNELPVDYEIEGNWFSVKRFPAGPLPRRQRRHFFVYLLPQSLGLEKVYTGKLILKYPGQEKILNVRVFVDNAESYTDDCNWLSRQGEAGGSGQKSNSCSPDRDILSERYSVEFPDVPISQPLITEDFVVITRQSGVITCMNEKNGTILWEYPCKSIITNTPSVADGKIYYSTIRGVIGCLNLSDGKHIWSKKLSSPPQTSLRVWRDKIFFGDYENNLVSLSTKDGSENEKFSPEGKFSKIPSVNSAKVFIGTDTGIFYCISAFDLSEPIWSVSAYSKITTSISVDGENCCFGTDNGMVYNVGARTGKFIWEKRLSSRVEGDIAISEDIVCVRVRSNTLYGISLKNGDVVWKAENWENIYAGPVISGDRVYLTADSRLYMLSAEDGLVIWSDDFGRPIRQFSVANKKIFACSQNRNLYCISSKPFIHFKPKVLNFGTLYPAKREKIDVKITNTTDRKVTINLTLDADWFTLSETKLYLDPNETVSVSARTIPYKVNDPGMRSGLIEASWENDSFGLRTWAYISRGDSPKVWSGFGGDNKNSNSNTEVRLNFDKLENIWNYKTNSPIFSSPLLDKGRLYVGSNDTDLRCIDADGGMLLWSFNTGGSIVSTGTLINDRIIFGSRDGYVYNLNSSTGKLHWKFFTGGNVSSCSTLRTSSKLFYVFFGTSTGRLFCLKVSTAGDSEDKFEVVWEKQFGSAITCSPVVHDKKIFITTTEGSIHCLDYKNGETVWNQNSYSTMSSPMLVDDYLIVETLSRGVICYNSNSGEKLWTNGSIYGTTSAVSLDESIIVCGSNGWVASLDTTSGDINWIIDVDSPIYSSPISDGNLVYVCDMGGGITGIDVDTGYTKWSENLYLPIISSPAIWNGRLYVGVCDSRVYCFGVK